jgi:hypothetical protein
MMIGSCNSDAAGDVQIIEVDTGWSCDLRRCYFVKIDNNDVRCLTILCIPMTRTESLIDSLMAESTRTNSFRAVLVHCPLWAARTVSHSLRSSWVKSVASGEWKRSRKVFVIA